MKPLGRVVGISEKTIDWSIIEPEREPEEQVDEEDGEELSITDVASDSNQVSNFIEVEGVNVYKATFLKNIAKDKPVK